MGDKRYNHRRSRGTHDTDKKRGQRISNGCFLIQAIVALVLLAMGIVIF